MMIKDQIISKISSFPTLPVSAGRLLNLLQDPDVLESDIVRSIQYDPALTANLLKAANSAFLGLTNRVNSLSEAVFRLGSKWIFQIAVSSLIYSNLNKPVSGYGLSREVLWKHSTAVAVMSDILGKQLNIKDVGLLFTAGLLHDVGKIVIGEFISESYDEIEQSTEDDKISFQEAERNVLGVDHAEIGGIIAENWRFPNNMVSAIRYHHNPDQAQESSNILDIVHVADALCLMQGYGLGRDDIRYNVNISSTKRLELTNSLLEFAAAQLVVSLEEINKALKEESTAVALRR